MGKKVAFIEENENTMTHVMMRSKHTKTIGAEQRWRKTGARTACQGPEKVASVDTYKPFVRRHKNDGNDAKVISCFRSGRLSKTGLGSRGARKNGDGLARTRHYGVWKQSAPAVPPGR